ncbi:MAG: 50S ribosomal protein L29 [Planctomycetota bacterium]|jgi:large subunit ribosomal protein L29
MKIREIRELTDEELVNELHRLRQHLFDVRSQAVTEKLEDSTLLQRTRQDIARILTVIQQRQTESVATASGQEAK